MNVFNTVKRFLEPLWYNKKETLLITSIGFALPILAMYGSFSVKIIADALTINDMVSFHNQLIKMGAVAVFIIIWMFAIRRCYVDFGEGIEHWILSKYAKKASLMDNTLYDSYGTGRFVEIMSKGQQSWASLLNSILEGMLASFIMVLLGMVNIYAISPMLFNTFLTFLLVLIFLLTVLNKKILGFRREYKDLHVETMRHYVRVLNCKFEILVNDKLDYEIDKIKSIRNQAKLLMYSVMDYVDSMFSSGRLFVWGARIGMFYFIGHGIMDGNIGIGSLAGLAVGLGFMDSAIGNFISHYKNFFKTMTDVTKLWDVFDTATYIAGYDEGNTFNFKKGDISLDSITFSYKEKPVFENFSLKIKGGTKVALVGKSGAGKTTLAKLIAGYVFPSSGTISIDGRKLNETALKTYYAHLGYLTQETSVFDGTVRENLTYGIKSYTEDEINKAIESAQCDFIKNLDKGLETEIGERGTKLSGGRKQRLAIAKIFLKNPEIVILDEPTSALDSESEDKISKAVHNLMKGRTVITIAHRLQTVKECDTIFVIGANSVLEHGTHNELVKLGGQYSKMVDLQSGNVLS